MRLESRFDEIGPALARLTAGLPLSDPDHDDLLHRIESAAAEVLNNVIEHAYTSASDHCIDIDLWLTSDRVFLASRDRGRPFSFARVAGETLAQAASGADLADRGYGWQIIRGTADDVAYDRIDGWNVLILEFRI